MVSRLKGLNRRFRNIKLTIRGRRYTVKKQFIIIPVVVLLLLVAFFLVRHYFYPKPSSEVTVQVEQGDSTLRIAQKLHDAGVVTSAFLFRTLAWVEGRSRDFQAGTYRMHVGMHYGEVFTLLKRGPQAAGRLTVPEGFSLKELAERVGQDTFISQDAFEQAAASGRFSSAYLPEDRKTNLEGFLFPKTYDLRESDDAASLIQQMLDQFDKEAAGLDWSLAGRLGLSKYQVVVAASIIEREARLDGERPIIAAVIYNRLAGGMMLQIDATVQYALARLPGQPAWKQDITYDDLKVESPYNTYRHFGLPPGPICNPGLASLQAALNPAQVDYLYYVATGTDGSHFFTRSYDEFLRVKNEQP